jgi:hypothetical protein
MASRVATPLRSVEHRPTDLQMPRDFVRGTTAVPNCCRYLQRNSVMAGIQRGDALLTVGLHGAVVSGFY